MLPFEDYACLVAADPCDTGYASAYKYVESITTGFDPCVFTPDESGYWIETTDCHYAASHYILALDDQHSLTAFTLYGILAQEVEITGILEPPSFSTSPHKFGGVFNPELYQRGDHEHYPDYIVMLTYLQVFEGTLSEEILLPIFRPSTSTAGNTPTLDYQVLISNVPVDLFGLNLDFGQFTIFGEQVQDGVSYIKVQIDLTDVTVEDNYGYMAWAQLDFYV